MRTNQKKTDRVQETPPRPFARGSKSSGERVWRLADFDGMPFTAVAQTLSRLARQGVIQRLGKGLYYRPRQTAFGPSRPNSAQIRSLPIRRKGVFPAGIAAANLLGFTTQNPARIELATNGSSLPRLIVGKETVIHTRRPESWQDALRDGRRPSRLPSQPGRVERAVCRGNGGQAARLLPRSRDASSACSRSPRRNRRVSARCSGPSASSSVSRKAGSRRCGRV